jgi:hypothetical protein
MLSFVALPAVPMKAAQPTMPFSMSAEMLTRRMSQVRRFLGGPAGG